MSNDYEKSVEALMKDVKELRDDMKDLFGALKAKAGSSVGDAMDSLHDSAAHRLEQVRDAAGAAGRRCHDGVKLCTEKMEEHPLVTVLAALGAGLVLGGLIRRHRR